MSATMFENDLDTDFFSMLDFNLAPPCEIDDGCEEEAIWKFFTNCCGELYLSCDEHLNRIKFLASGQVKKVVCKKCRHPVGPGFVVGLEKI